ANGVHPVPLGFGRVYVQCPRGFSFEAWWRGLDAGRSFVTTGPMLQAEVDGRTSGARFTLRSDSSRSVKIACEVISDQPVSAVELIVNGEIVHRFVPESHTNRDGASVAKFHTSIELTGSSWIALRCWEPREGGRIRFA